MQSKFFSRFLFVGLMFWIAPLKAQSILSTARDVYIAATNQNTTSLYYSQQNINVTDENGNTALCIAYKKEDWKSYSLLMRYGASPKVKCMKTLTAPKKTAPVAYTPIQNATSSDGTFLGMGPVGWTTVGVLAAGGITAASLGGGGGGGGSSDKCKNVDCGEHGTCNNGTCVCETGYEGEACEGCAGGYVMQAGICYEEIGKCILYHPSTGECIECENYTNYYLKDGECPARTNTENCTDFVETEDKCKACINTTQYNLKNGMCLAYQTCEEMNPNYTDGSSAICTGGAYDCTPVGTLADGTQCYTYVEHNCNGFNAETNTGCTQFNSCTDTIGKHYQCTACNTAKGYDFDAGNLTCEPRDCSDYVSECPKGYKPTKMECISAGVSYYSSCEIIDNDSSEETEQGETPEVFYKKTFDDNSYAEMAVIGADQNIYNAAGTVDENDTYTAGVSSLSVSQYTITPLYGMYIESKDSSHSYTVYNAYSKESSQESNGSISVTQKGQNGDNVVGMAVDIEKESSNATVVNAGSNSQGSIAVKNAGTGSGSVYGIQSKGYVYNNQEGKAGTIEVSSAGTGDVYGIYGKQSTTNISSSLDSAQATIKATTDGNGHVYGIYSSGHIYNAYKNGIGNIEATASTETATDVYGIYSSSYAYNAYTNEPDHNAIGIIKVTNKGSGNSYGINALGGSNGGYDDGTATGWIILSDGNTGTGDIYGFYSSGDEIENAYDGTGYITSFEKDDTTYSSSLLSVEHNYVYGMYTSKQAELYNARSDFSNKNVTGIISLKGNVKSGLYGIYAHMGTVYNANSEDKGETTASIMLENTNTTGGNVYGMYGKEVYNAYGVNANGTISVKGISGSLYGIYTASKAYNGYNGGVGKIVLKGSSDVKAIGMSSFEGSDTELYNAYDGKGTITNLDENKNILLSGNGDIIGMETSTQSAKIYNAYQNEETESEVIGLIELKTDSGANLYGIINGDNRGSYNAVGNASGYINLTTTGSGSLYGMSGDNGSIYNALQGGKGHIDLTVNNGDNESDIYGMYGEDADIANALTLGDDNTNGDIKITSNGTGSLYGISGSSQSIINAYGKDTVGNITITSTNDNAKSIYGIRASGRIDNASDGGKGTITISGKSKGDVSAIYGIYANGTDGTDEIYNSYAQGSEGKIQITDTGSGLSYGMYAPSGKLYNANESSLEGNIITVTSKGLDAYGMYSDSGNVINANKGTGTITVTNSVGKAYGMYLKSGSTSYYNAYGASSNGTITVTSSGLGYAYGMYSDSGSVINAYQGNGTITVTSNGEGYAYGMYLKSGSTSTSYYNACNKGTGTIEVTSSGLGDAYGMYLESGSTNYYNAFQGGKGTINVTSEKSGKAYGMYSNSESGSLYNAYEGTGTINVTSSGSDNAYGMYSNGASLYNLESSWTGTINVTSEKSGNAYGMYSNGTGAVVNYGTINITSDSNAYGIYSNLSGNVRNNGIIQIHGGNGGSDAYGIYAGSGSSSVINEGAIVIGGTATKSGGTYTTTADSNPGTRQNAYGIYAKGDITNTGTIAIYSGHGNDGGRYGIYLDGSGTLTNTGNIIIEKEDWGDNYRWEPLYGSSAVQLYENNGYGVWGPVEGEYQIYVKSNFGAPARLVNAGTFSSAENLNFVTENGGTVLSMKDAVWQAPSIAGDITMASNIVQDGFETTYETIGTFETEDVSQLNLLSQSVLFEASLDENKSDVQLTMKDFSDVVDNSSLSHFLEENYTLQNNEEMFSEIKGMESVKKLNDSLDDMFGKEVFSRFMFEDLTMIHELSFDMNSKLFANEKADYETTGFVMPFAFNNNKGSDGRYSLTSTSFGNMSLGFGVSFSDIRSDDGDTHNTNNRKDTTFMMSMPMGYKTNGFHLISTPRLGYSYGTYDRKGFEGTNYDGTIQKRIFALTNEARYPVKLGKWTLSPSMEANFIGYRMKGHEDEDGAYSLVIPNQEKYSMTTGFGLYATNEMNVGKKGKLSFNIGGSIYHEFLDAYDMELGMRSMKGHFKLQNSERRDNFGVIRAGLDFNIGDVTLTSRLNSYIDHEYHTEAKLNLKYAF